MNTLPLSPIGKGRALKGKFDLAVHTLLKPGPRLASKGEQKGWERLYQWLHYHIGGTDDDLYRKCARRFEKLRPIRRIYKVPSLTLIYFLCVLRVLYVVWDLLVPSCFT